MPHEHTSRAPLSRRHSLMLAAAGATGLVTAAAGTAAASAAGPAPLPAGGRRLAAAPAEGDTAHVAVTATTLWVAPDTHRDGIDDPAVSTPVDLDAWNTAMEDTETRRWLTGKLETQAVLGREVIVDEIDGDWARIVVTSQPTPRDPRGYPGWVPLAHLAADAGFAASAADCATATVTALTTRLGATPAGRSTGTALSFDTVLPVLGHAGSSVRVAVPGQRPAYLPVADLVVRAPGEEAPRPTAEDVIATGERFLDLRYLWAGVSAYGFDCSGYTHTLLRHHGITIARDAGAQRNDSGLEVVEREDLQRGDLVFFSSGTGSTSIRHVAVYLGDDQILHAPNAARSVEVVSLSAYDTEDEYAGARRIAYAQG